MDRSHKRARQIYDPLYHSRDRTTLDEAARFDDVEHEPDFPRDDFDKQLLRDYPNENFGHFRKSSTRYSVPSALRHGVDRVENTRRPREDFEYVRRPTQSSSSPTFPFSSPTTSALQKRSQPSQRTKAVVPPVPQTPRSSNFGNRFEPRTEDRSLTASANFSQAPPTIRGIPLVPTDRLPDRMRSVFEFELFNAVQSKCFTAAFETDDNIVLSAPTGSGKTVIMELAICRLLSTNKSEDFKVVYQAPTKSLCNERCRDWTAKFKTLNLQCAELTGDVEFAQLKAVQSAHVIITTPEKWDSVTRKWRDNARLMQMIKLFLVDEVHILNESRGATLEAVVSRMKSAGSGVRFVALSATVPNSEDIAVWLGRSPTTQHLPAYREVFDEAFRPVTLEKHVIGYSCNPNDFALDSILTKEIPAIMAKHAKKKPVMIFCMTKASAMRTAKSLAELWSSTTPRLRLWNQSKRQINVTNQDLQKLLPTSVAFHHGALDPVDRRAVEQGFLDGNINIICSTSTLAVGVNLPCYLVILKGTTSWSDNGIQEYSSLEVMQMLGRAGRPQYETSACAVILTHTSKTRHYEDMVSGQEILESSLHKNLIEHLNAEISIGTIHDAKSAKKWLTSSFLSVRLQQNPTHYRLQSSDTNVNPEQLLEQICEKDLKLLQNAKLIKESGGLRCTDDGNAMARYYVQYETMLAFSELPAKAKLSDILHVLVQAREFSDLKLRAGEKPLYKELNKGNDIRFPIKIDIAMPAHKTSLLIQAQLAGVVLDKSNTKYLSQFKQDSLTAMNHCNRLIKCIIDMQLSRQDGTAVRNALELCRSLAAGVWDNTPMQLKQIESIGDVTARKLASAGISSIEKLLSTEPHRIEVVLGKTQPFGTLLLKKASTFPSLRVSVKEVDRKRKGASKGAEIRLRSEVGYLNDSLPSYFNRRPVYILFLCETSNGTLVDFRRFAASQLRKGEEILLTVLLDRQCDSIICHVMCDEVAGTHRYAELRLDIPANCFPLAESLQQSVIPRERTSIKSTVLFDDFDDTNLEDEDFLVAELNTDNCDNVEVVEDIDDALQMQEKPTKTGSSLKRKAEAAASNVPQSQQTNVYRESVQLPNGNWTCQHTCKEDGRECKHKCCMEGVKRPKKRVKTQEPTSKPAMTIREALAKPSAISSKASAETVHDIDEILRGSARLLQSARTHDTDGFPTKERIIPSQMTERNQTQEAEATQAIRIDDFSSDNLPTASAILSESKKRSEGIEEITGHDNVSRIDDAVFDIDAFGTEAADCDWDWGGSCLKSQERSAILKDADVERNLGVYDDSIGDASQKLAHTVRPKVPEREQEAGLLSHPKQAVLRTSESTLEVPEDDTFDTDLEHFNDIDDTDFMDLDKRSHHEAMPIPTPMPPRSKTPLANTRKDEPLSKPLDYQFYKPDMAERERRKRLHEEDQRKRWARLPASLYEEYGAYVDLV